MPRNRHLSRRGVQPDPLYNDIVISKLINNIMIDGKKGTLEIVAEQTGEDAIEVFNQAINNIMPVLEVKGRRIGGATYQVPIEVRPERRETLGLRWLVKYSRERGEKTMVERLAKEILDAANGMGGSVRKKEEVHKMAEANKAFAHYRW